MVVVLFFALGGPECCAKAHCRPTRPIGIGRTGNEANSRGRRETDPAQRGNAQIFVYYYFLK